MAARASRCRRRHGQGMQWPCQRQWRTSSPGLACPAKVRQHPAANQACILARCHGVAPMLLRTRYVGIARCVAASCRGLGSVVKYSTCALAPNIKAVPALWHQGIDGEQVQVWAERADLALLCQGCQHSTLHGWRLLRPLPKLVGGHQASVKRPEHLICFHQPSLQ